VSPVDTGSSLTQLLKVLRRQRWKLLALMAIAVAAAVIVQLVVPKVYEGSALVRIEHHSGNGMLGQDAVPTNDMDQIITTYIELAQSDPVLRPVAERYHLLEAKGLTPEQVKQRLDAPIVLKNLKVTRLPNSYLLHITYRANNPRLAADVANAVAESLSEHAHDTEKRSSEQMSSLVAQSLSSLRTRMEASDKALVEYEKKLNMVNPQQRATIQAARLMQLNTDYTAAQTERVRRQNILREVQSSQSLASAQTAQASSQDNLLNETVQRLNAARQQFALAKSYYGPNHPDYVKAQQQVQEMEAQLAEQQERAKDRAKAEYQEAVGRENQLQQILQQTKAEVDGLQASAHQYEQIKSEADNEKKLYEELETQARLADIKQQFQNATVQIAAAAGIPRLAVFPNLLINLPLAIVLAGILGILVAVLSDAMNPTFADPDEVANLLQLDILAAIPVTHRLPVVLTDHRTLNAPAEKA
jgi:uncharacterized protein involved in exopolysaccharide biosynthesis